MGRLEDQPENLENGPEIRPEIQAADVQSSVLQSMTQDLRTLQQDLVSQLHQDIRRLQAEKSRLLNDVEKLQNQQQTLQTQHEISLSRQQLAQQQAWAKQLALALANHLQIALSQRMGQMGSPYPIPGTSDLSQMSGSEETQRSIATLDDTVNRAFAALRNDLNSYQSTLSQQITRMQEMGQQGEAILEVLVGRITQQLQHEMGQQQRGYLDAPAAQTGAQLPIAPDVLPIPPVSPPLVSPPPRPAIPPTQLVAGPTAGAADSSPDSSPLSQTSGTAQPLSSAANAAPLPRSAPPGTSLRRPASSIARAAAPIQALLRSHKLSSFQLGLIMMLCSTLALSLHNVIVGIVGNPSKLFGLIPIGGYISIRGFGSSLFILWMRMLVVVPLMAWLAGFLHPPTWRDVRYFFEAQDRRLMMSVIGSGFFLFLSQVFIYIAIGDIGPGIAITILYMYPIVTVPLAWVLFGDRPNRFRLIVMVVILSGVILTALPKISETASFSAAGVGAAIAAVIFFACYLVSMQISFRKLHPVPVSLIQFVTMFILTSVSLIVMGIEVTPTNRTGLFVSGIILGVLTLIGYLLNNFGVRFMGAARASIIAASGPVLTAFLAFFIIPGELTVLHFVQLVGILTVTLGVTALSFERIVIQNRKESRQAGRASSGKESG